MEDRDIISLYFQRSEIAIIATKEKYHSYCTTIAYNILSSFEDTEEVVSDTYLRAWNAIQPTNPAHFKAFLGRITHNLAINRYRANNARKHSSLTDVLMELEISNLEDPEEETERRALADTVSQFLHGLEPHTRKVFVLRYWYYDTIPTISRKTGIKEATINSMLYRTRKNLKTYLEKEGWTYETK